MADEAPRGITIACTPATLADGTPQADDYKRLLDELEGDRPTVTPEYLDQVRSRGWFRAEVQRRGAYLSTKGLGEEVDHRELAMINVPSAFVAAAAELLSDLAGHLLEFDDTFEAGETFSCEEGVRSWAVAFAEPSADVVRELRSNDAPLLVVLLP